MQGSKVENWPHQNQSILVTTALVAKNEQQKKLHTHSPITLINWKHNKANSHCLEPKRLFLDEDVCAKKGGKEKKDVAFLLSPSHGPLRYATSHSRVTRLSRSILCEKTKRLRRGQEPLFTNQPPGIVTHGLPLNLLSPCSQQYTRIMLCSVLNEFVLHLFDRGLLLTDYRIWFTSSPGIPHDSGTTI